MAKKDNLEKELVEVRKVLVGICDRVDESSPYYNYLMNGLMFVDEATRIANGTCPLNRKWLHYYADKCV